jgi:amidase
MDGNVEIRTREIAGRPPTINTLKARRLPGLLRCGGRMRRLALLLLVAALAACKAQPPAPGTHAPDANAAAKPTVDVVELGADAAARQMADGTLTSRVLTQAYLDRIAAIDKAGPSLHAVIELAPDALAQADALDTERKAGHVRGPMHGLPVLLKDNIDAVGMANSAGSLALADNHPAHDAFLVARLRDAGAVILGKTNLSEWANFRSTRATSGWSSRGGQTRNPYVLDRNPCGSSAGTGAAIAASLAAIGVGTETDGSIICPAAVNGLVGLKPTVGLVSRGGIIPISISQDTAGPMGRRVADVARLLGAMAAADASDPAGMAAAEHLPADYTTQLKPDALAGKRIGVLRQAMGWHPGVDAAMENAIATLRAQGAQVQDVTVPTWGQWDEAELDTLLYEFKDGLDAYLRAAGTTPASLEALVAWNQAHAEAAMPWFGQELFERAVAKGPLTEPAYAAARDKARRLAGREGLLKVLDAGRLDALVAPAASPAWVTDPVLGDHFIGAGYGIAAVAGTPSLSVPMGDVHGLPVGIVFLGRAWSEPQLLGFGYAFEQATHARKPPTYRPTLAP